MTVNRNLELYEEVNKKAKETAECLLVQHKDTNNVTC
jgi:hypothetical protein